MTDSISRLKEILEENGVVSFRGLNGLSPQSRARLDSTIYAWFTNFKSEHLQILRQTPGLNLCLGLRKNIDAEMDYHRSTKIVLF